MATGLFCQFDFFLILFYVIIIGITSWPKFALFTNPGMVTRAINKTNNNASSSTLLQTQFCVGFKPSPNNPSIAILFKSRVNIFVLLCICFQLVKLACRLYFHIHTLHSI
jgi:hypothetical protein